MRFFRITNGFNKMSDAYLLVRARFIYNAMTGNTNFPNATPSLSELNSTINSFQSAVEAAEGGSRQDVAVKNQIRETLILQLHLLGNYVLFTAGNNEVIATSSGFHVSKVGTPTPPITNPEGVELRSGLNKGELEISCKKVTGAKSYVHEITKTPVTSASVWQPITTTQAKNVWEGLQSGEEYAARIAAVGVRKQRAYSAVVTRIAL